MLMERGYQTTKQGTMAQSMSCWRRAERAMLKVVVGQDQDAMCHTCRSSGSSAMRDKIVQVMESARRESQVKHMIMEQC